MNKMGKIGSVELSRRSLLTGVAIAGSLPVAAMSSEQAPAFELACIPHCSKVQAAYQDSPVGNQHCSNCYLWRPPHFCAYIDGVISSNGWCPSWKQKTSIKA
jgi:hypothetical protein